ncbi:MAG: fumarylacetoacetate hydrolase family protein [Acidobacteria bacterium]|nr:fumarylacetoacetate hydrolase family protein [Acidobacteriota bacterium]
MRWCRFDDSRLGIVDGAFVADVTAALDVLPAYRYPLPAHDVLIANLPAVAARVRAMLPGAPRRPLPSVTLLSPVANPGKLIAAPVNYQKHLDEVKSDSEIHAGNPKHTITIQSAGLFLKATSSLVGPGQGVSVRKPERRTDHEVELAVVIGREASHVPRHEALACVAGYCIGLDITIRGSEDRSFRKSVDTYSVLGPWLVDTDEVPDPGSLDLQITVNGELRQKSNTRCLILGVPALIELASSFYTLYPGDVIFTGTPEGVGPIEPGDLVEARIEAIGAMQVRVRDADATPLAALSGAAADARP